MERDMFLTDIFLLAHIGAVPMRKHARRRRISKRKMKMSSKRVQKRTSLPQIIRKQRRKKKMKAGPRRRTRVFVLSFPIRRD